jgi:ABC-type lipoprotein release transport system permease subunit
MIFLKDINQVPAVEDRLRKVFSDEKFRVMEKDSTPFFLKMDRVTGESWTGQKIDITTWEDETSFLKWIIQLLTTLTYALVFVLLIIIVIGLMNALWMSIRERTSEIGTLRAIGLQKTQVFTLFLLESFLLCLGSTLVGATTGALTANFLDRLRIPLNIEALRVFLMSNTLSFQIGAAELTQVFVIMLAFLMLGSLIPIWQASRLKPVTAMQSAT